MALWEHLADSSGNPFENEAQMRLTYGSHGAFLFGMDGFAVPMVGLRSFVEQEALSAESKCPCCEHPWDFDFKWKRRRKEYAFETERHPLGWRRLTMYCSNQLEAKAILDDTGCSTLWLYDVLTRFEGRQALGSLVTASDALSDESVSDLLLNPRQSAPATSDTVAEIGGPDLGRPNILVGSRGSLLAIYVMPPWKDAPGHPPENTWDEVPEPTRIFPEPRAEAAAKWVHALARRTQLEARVVWLVPEAMRDAAESWCQSHRFSVVTWRSLLGAIDVVTGCNDAAAEVALADRASPFSPMWPDDLDGAFHDRFASTGHQVAFYSSPVGPYLDNLLTFVDGQRWLICDGCGGSFALGDLAFPSGSSSMFLKFRPRYKTGSKKKRRARGLRAALRSSPQAPCHRHRFRHENLSLLDCAGFLASSGELATQWLKQMGVESTSGPVRNTLFWPRMTTILHEPDKARRRRTTWCTTPDLLFLTEKGVVAVEAKLPHKSSGIFRAAGIGEVLQRIGHAVRLQLMRGLRGDDARVVVLTNRTLNRNKLFEEVWKRLQDDRCIKHWTKTDKELYAPDSDVVECLTTLDETAFSKLLVTVSWRESCEAMVAAAETCSSLDFGSGVLHRSLANRMLALTERVSQPSAAERRNGQ